MVARTEKSPKADGGKAGRKVDEERALDGDYGPFFAPTHGPLTSSFRNIPAPPEDRTDTLSGGLKLPPPTPPHPPRLHPPPRLSTPNEDHPPWIHTVPPASQTSPRPHNSTLSPSPVTVPQLPVYPAAAP